MDGQEMNLSKINLTTATVQNVASTLVTSSLPTAGLVELNEVDELKEKINQLMGKPYYMKISCHNCGAPLTIDSSNHLIKCPYCRTAYLSGTQLVNAGIK